MYCRLLDIKAHVLREHLSPFIADEDVLATKLVCHHLNESMEGREFSLESMERNPSLQWWKWVVGLGDDAGFYLKHLARLAPIHEMDEVVDSLCLNPIDMDVTASMCNGAARRGDLAVINHVRATYYNAWDTVLPTLAKYGHLDIIKHLIARGYAHGKDHDVISGSTINGIGVGCFGTSDVINFFLDANAMMQYVGYDICELEGIVIGLVLGGNTDLIPVALQRFRDQWGTDLSISRLVRFAVAYGRVDSFEYLMGLPGLEIDHRLIEVVESDSGGVANGIIHDDLGIAPDWAGKMAIETLWISWGFDLPTDRPDRFFYDSL